MKRRRFLELAGMGLGNSLVGSKLARGLSHVPSNTADVASTYGSGHFGTWIKDEFDLPAYHYTCDQLKDPKAISPTEKAWRAPTDHTHQIGNDRLVALASNYGYVQVRQDEGSPKLLNDYAPQNGRYGGGIGFLSDGQIVLSTYDTGNAEQFDRVMGMGYLRKQVRGNGFEIDHVLFAPFGDDPVLVSQVSITNHTSHTAQPRWIEYWGCHQYQLSYRSLMEAALLGDATDAVRLRREFAERFTHSFEPIHKSGLLHTQTFLGRSADEEAAWQRTQAKLKADPNGFYGGPVPPLAPGASMDDFAPPATFLLSLDAPIDGFATNGAEFLQSGIEHPAGALYPLRNELSTTGPESALLLERNLLLKPGEKRSLYFLYGYLPQGFNLDSLIAKYAEAPETLWKRSSGAWRKSATTFSASGEPWVERETAWASYYIRSGLTYDSFFKEHILSQGAGYQYVAGLQGAARDPLQHALPMVLSNPAAVREILRYTLKEIQPDGAIPYGIVGAGVSMPCRYRPSDSELWLLWLASEYVLATRDQQFLSELIPAWPQSGIAPSHQTVGELLAHAYERLTVALGVGVHGLMRLSNGDWNDSIVVNRLSAAQVADAVQHGESVLNAAMSCYVFDHYARMLDFTGNSTQAQQARRKADKQREAVRAQWTGHWFKRAWLGEELGWSGEKQMWAEPQPWAIIGGAANFEQRKLLLASIDDLLRKPSPIGALLQSKSDETMRDNPGVGTNGGIFAAINGTLVWALAMADGAMAWDEWKKNSLARHADVYPELWYGIWSGPDAYNSVLAKDPGATQPDFPVLNMHSHAWPLYSAVKLLGVEFEPSGVSFNPTLPVAEYFLNSSLLGFKKSTEGYSGWYAPLRVGSWNIDIVLSQAERHKRWRATVNGAQTQVVTTDYGVRIVGSSSPDVPLRWTLY